MLKIFSRTLITLSVLGLNPISSYSMENTSLMKFGEKSMLDHFSLSVRNYEASLNFYDESLKTLGYKRVMTIDIKSPDHPVQCAGYGEGEKPSFWISAMGSDSEDIGRARGVHIAFTASSANDVNEWHKKCLEMGGTDNGAPGQRAEYHPGYYGAFIVDPNGWRIEAVFHGYRG